MNKEISFPELPIEDMHAEHTSNTLDADKVAYTELTKEELIKVLESKDKSLDNYSHMGEQHKKELDNMNEYYVARIKELNSIISYYERTLNVLKDIITLETDKGGDK